MRMKKWTWQWLALLGLVGMIVFMVDWVKAELASPAAVSNQDVIEIYHEPLYYDHFLAKIVEPGSPGDRNEA